MPFRLLTFVCSQKYNAFHEPMNQLNFIKIIYHHNTSNEAAPDIRGSLSLTSINLLVVINLILPAAFYYPIL